MNYTLEHMDSDTGRLVLRRSNTLERVLGSILILMGGVLTPLGLLIFLSPDPNYYSSSFWTGLGLFLFMGGIMLLTQLRIPEKVIFDNKNGECIIQDKRNEAAGRATIPYQEIQGFETRYHRSGRSGYYAAEMKKTDGAFWSLFTSQNKTKAENFCKQLQGAVDLQVSSTGKKQILVPVNVTVSSEGEKEVVTWRVRPTFRDYVILVSLVGSMGMMMYGAKPLTGGSFQYILGLSFIGGIALLSVFSILNNVGRKHRVEISQESFTYQKIGGLIRRGEFSILNADIDAILFNFLFGSDGAIYILEREEKERFQNINRGDYPSADFVSAYQFLRQIRKLDVGILPIAEKIHLEELLQNILLEISGRQGL